MNTCTVERGEFETVAECEKRYARFLRERCIAAARKELLSAHSLAERFGVSANTISQWSRRYGFPVEPMEGLAHDAAAHARHAKQWRAKRRAA